MSGAKGELIVLHDRRDRLEANRVVRKLESAGYCVERQDKLAGLRRSKSDAPTVVLWSRNAGTSSMRSVLDRDAVIARIDSRAAPLGAQVTDLRGWRGQDRHQGWKTLLEAVGPAAMVAPAKIVANVPASAKAVAAPGSKASKKSASPKTAVADNADATSDRVHPVVIAITTLVLLGLAAGAAAVFFL